MDLGLLHSHHLIVILYLLLLVVHLFFLFTGNRQAFTSFRGKAKWFRMSLEILMLLTGGFLLFRAPDGFAVYNLVKIFGIGGAIALTIIGFKRYKAPLVLGAVLLLGYVYGVAKMRSPLLTPESKRVASAWEQAKTNNPEDSLAQGQVIYTIACQRCHGVKGEAQYRKAKLLKESQLPDGTKASIIQNGLNTMPKFDYLDESQRRAVVAYINTFTIKGSN